jgi:hypothetical protein
MLRLASPHYPAIRTLLAYIYKATKAAHNISELDRLLIEGSLHEMQIFCEQSAIKVVTVAI